jgi:triosephosphate isomerase
MTDSNIDGLILGSACDSVKKTMAIASAMTDAKPEGRKILHTNFKAYELKDKYEDYIKAFQTLDKSFSIYISPCHTDLFRVRQMLS